MSYKAGTISNLIASGENTQGLANIFNDGSKTLFARSFKPEEFPALKVDKKADEEDEKKDKKKKKPKKAKVTEGTDESKPVEEVVTNAEDDSARTMFVGNVPVTETVRSITKLFQEYGPIDSVRLRSVPVAGAKVDDAGNQNLVKKVCVNAKKLGEQKGSFNAYIVFKTKEGAIASLAANNRVVGERHLRVDRSNPTLFDTNKTVFLGNLPHYADEEELREYFATVLPNKQDDIEAVRIIRDPETLVGKGIGYLLLKDRDAVMKALSLHQEMYKKRWSLRVTVCGKRTKRSEFGKKPKENSNESLSTAEGSDSATTAATGASSASGVGAKRKPEYNRSKLGGESNKTKENKKRKLDAVDFAAKRIKLKSTMTRNKYLKERHQKKAEPGRKGKRLGGVVKRAMKAAAGK